MAGFASRTIASFAIVALLFVVLAAAAPQVNYPLNSQYPPVARVGQFYSFQFASTTFQPEPEKLQYSITRSPPWLSLNGRNRTLSGTPGSGDVGPISFTITAAAEAGAVANMESKLLVVETGAPSINGNILQQLAKAGSLAAPRTLALSPSEHFDFELPSDTFADPAKKLSYHATLFDHTPLPSWISFDAASLHFSGTTPPITSSPEVHEILLIASDDEDFAVATLSFTIAISNHKLLFKPMEHTITIPKGGPVVVNSLRSALLLDDAPVTDMDIPLAYGDFPSWLKFDPRTFAISGTAPPGQMSQNITITAKSRFGDTAQAVIRLVFKSQLFNGEVGPLNITAGDPFAFRIPRSIFTNGNDVVSLDFDALGKWLRFDSSTLIVSGTIPKGQAVEDTEATMTVSSRTAPERKDSQTFPIYVAAAVTASHNSKNHSPTSARPTSTNSGTPAAIESNAPSKSKKAGVIVGSVLGAIIASLLLILAALFLCKQRRKRRQRGSPRKSYISRPIMASDEWDDIDRTLDPDLEKGEGDVTMLERTPERPPRLDLDLPLKDHDTLEGRKSEASIIGDGEAKILTAFDRSSWGRMDDEAGPSHHPQDSMKLPTAMARRSSDISNPTAKRRRRTTTVYRDSSRSGGLPIKRRLTGLGHGRHTFSSSRNNISLHGFKRRDCVSMGSYSTRSTSVLSTTPSAFPRPPSTRHSGQPAKFDKHCSIRLVPSRSGSVVDHRTIGERRQSYIRKRASAQSPFFGASSRASSSSYKPPAHLTDIDSPGALRPTHLMVNKFKPQDSVINRRDSDLPESLRIRKPSATPSVESPAALQVFTGSLRKPPGQRTFATRQHTSSPGATRNDDRLSPVSFSRPGPGYQAITRNSLVREQTKDSQASVGENKIFEDAEMSDSVYSTEDEEEEDMESRRATLKPQHYTNPIHRLNPLRKSKRDSATPSTRRSAIYARAQEHGGKENQSPSYRLSLAAAEKGKAKASSPSRSPERPKTSHRNSRPDRHSRSGSGNTPRSTRRHKSQDRPSSSRRQPAKSPRSGRSENSRSRSRSHSQTQQTTKHTRDRSRTQSSAYPYFETPILPLNITDPRKASSQSPQTQGERANTSVLRTKSGNVLDYALHEDGTIEELEAQGVRTSRGRISPEARKSRITRLAESSRSGKENGKSKRETVVHLSRNTRGDSYGLGLSFGDEHEGGEETRTPLGLIGVGTPSPERLRVVEGKGRRPVSVEGERRNGGKRGWGSLKAVMTGGSAGDRRGSGSGSEAFL